MASQGFAYDLSHTGAAMGPGGDGRILPRYKRIIEMDCLSPDASAYEAAEFQFPSSSNPCNAVVDLAVVFFGGSADTALGL